ncbi:hypothetical protein MLD38_019220 [Melastoma candidum]|uniref:Uncharacterized protein n=2 Tax=Melastoma candidum TaxID=119954 RepID=A0ACB9QWB1_9MYRT|nr:hypothetical protein MLD38_019220 [Melastoma candidum]
MGGTGVPLVKKPNVTPKAVIHEKFGGKASYTIEEVHEAAPNGCPGLAIPQKGPCLYRCHLQLPDFSVISETFRKKKDAEQCAAQMAVQKLGVYPSANSPTTEDASNELVSRIEYLFSDEFLTSESPLGGHFRAALRRNDNLCGAVPVSVFAVYDGKINSLWKVIDPKVEINHCSALSFILRAAVRSPSLVQEGSLLVRRKSPYPSELVDSVLMDQSSDRETAFVNALYIPCDLRDDVKEVTLSICPSRYYLDIVAEKLGQTDASKVLISRPIGKASSEIRLHFSASHDYLAESLVSTPKNGDLVEGPVNVRASFLASQEVYGAAVLASIGYKWKSKDLFFEDVSMQSYYRMLIGKIPSGAYKVSREAIFGAELPTSFTTKNNWRGSFPREMLSSFCRQHRLSEPVFKMSRLPLKENTDAGSQKQLKVTKSALEVEHTNGDTNVVDNDTIGDSESLFRCEVKVSSRLLDLLIQCSPKELYKKHSDGFQDSSLKVLSFLNAYLLGKDMSEEKFNSLAEALDIQFEYPNLLKEFKFSPSVNRDWKVRFEGGTIPNIGDSTKGNGDSAIHIEGPESGVFPSSGCLASTKYTVCLVSVDKSINELLESVDEFEFEMGSGAIIPHAEAALSQMYVDQSARFSVNLPGPELLMAAARDPKRVFPLINSGTCLYLEFCLSLLGVTEPLEERMEQAFFNPPLSKQRVEYAVQHIRDSGATSLVDFGCGSGSLLDSLLNFSTSLRRIAGVDISLKGLARAAKILHTKLNKSIDADSPCSSIESAILYDGSITEFDSRLQGFDIGTCLEVIEHMEEDQATSFGNIVLKSFCPKILIISTPNYEYNVILQKSNLPDQEDDPDEKACRFRNHDHKFEWTREQFSSWAFQLANSHDYTVEFSGVGGSGDCEPGFASQIAVFRRKPAQNSNGLDSHNQELVHCPYNTIWEWSAVIPPDHETLSSLYRHRDGIVDLSDEARTGT